MASRLTVSTRSLTDEYLGEFAPDEPLTPEQRTYLQEEQEVRKRVALSGRHSPA